MRLRCGKADRAGGFTLVEVMVALMIVAVAVSALLFQIMHNLDHAAYLRDKTLAHWVALNQLEYARIANQQSNQLPQREQSGEVAMASRQWQWRSVPKKTAAEGFIQLQIVVADSRDPDHPLATVTGLLDSFHGSLP